MSGDTNTSGSDQDSRPRHTVIVPKPFVPHEGLSDLKPREELPRARRSWPVRLALGVALLGLTLPLAFLFLATPVEVDLSPATAELQIEGWLTGFKLDGRHLLLPGQHALLARADGHEELRTELDVLSGDDMYLRLELTPLPGKLRLIPSPPDLALRFGVDGGEQVPFTGELIELSAGVHVLHLSADGHLDARATLRIQGRNEEQDLPVELKPVPEPSPGQAAPRGPQVSRLRVESEPSGATLLVDGRSAGTTPVTIETVVGRDYELTARLPGHRQANATVEGSVARGDEGSARLVLEPLLAEVRLDVSPANASYSLDGVDAGLIPKSLSLPAVPHVIELRAAGHASHRVSIQPTPEKVSLISVSLRRLADIEEARNPARRKAALDMELVRVDPGRARLGAGRREPGRRSNETERDVEITRAFYLGAKEVTNAQFRQFHSAHDSGLLGGHSLDGEDQPVVRVSWEQAARFCNWLSLMEGLTPVYEEGGGGLRARADFGTGYRLPTEAEWEFAARTDASGERWRFSWGDAPRPPAGAANVADQAAGAFAASVVPGLSDGAPVSAEVGRFAKDRRGLHDLNGNVSEWTHDHYGIPGAGPSSAKDPRGPESGDAHVVRGASFLHGSLSELRLSSRERGQGRRPDLGFRVARSTEGVSASR